MIVIAFADDDLHHQGASFASTASSLYSLLITHAALVVLEDLLEDQPSDLPADISEDLSQEKSQEKSENP